MMSSKCIFTTIKFKLFLSHNPTYVFNSCLNSILFKLLFTNCVTRKAEHVNKNITLEMYLLGHALYEYTVRIFSYRLLFLTTQHRNLVKLFIITLNKYLFSS